MHPVFMEGLAAEHIKAMTQAADKARQVRQARRGRHRRGARRTGSGYSSPASSPAPGMLAASRSCRAAAASVGATSTRTPCA